MDYSSPTLLNLGKVPESNPITEAVIVIRYPTKWGMTCESSGGFTWVGNRNAAIICMQVICVCHVLCWVPAQFLSPACWKSLLQSFLSLCLLPYLLNGCGTFTLLQTLLRDLSGEKLCILATCGVVVTQSTPHNFGAALSTRHNVKDERKALLRRGGRH